MGGQGVMKKKDRGFGVSLLVRLRGLLLYGVGYFLFLLRAWYSECLYSNQYILYLHGFTISASDLT